MLSLTTHTQIPSSNYRVSRLSAHLIPALVPACKSKKRDGNCQKALFLGLRLTKESPPYRYGGNLDQSWSCGCMQSEGGVDLEAEIMGFMANSDKPTIFPTKEELVRAGRLDLVESIKKRGGWYSLGWGDDNVGDDLEETIDSDLAEFQRRIQSWKLSGSSSFSEGVRNSTSRDLDSDIADFQRRIKSCKLSGSSSFSEGVHDSTSRDLDSDIANFQRRIETQLSGSSSVSEGVRDSTSQGLDSDIANFQRRIEKQLSRSSSFSEGVIRSTSRDLDSTQLTGSHSFDTPSQLDVNGVEGILSRLKKQRKNSLINTKSGKKAYEAESTSKDEGDDSHSDSSIGFETWRSWSSRRAGFQNTEFEAAEISAGKNPKGTDKESYRGGTTKEYAEALTNCNDLQTHLQSLKSELTTSLQSVRSNREDNISEEVIGSFSELESLCDALELRENEVMRAKDGLRSIRSKIAILRGKITLATFNARKTAEVKQKKIDASRKSSQLLRSTSIVFHAAAKEVLLTGSFDGWTTQRRMEKSKFGIFSITLKLYPGRYEIKFIVDGKWRVDYLRPIVDNNGHENNLFTVK